MLPAFLCLRLEITSLFEPIYLHFKQLSSALQVPSADIAAGLQGVTSRRQAQDWMQQHWRELLQQMQDAGWQTQQAPLAQSDHTAEWGHQLSTHTD